MRTGKQAGFSLLEVTIVAAIGMIVTATAVPNMVTAIANMRLRSSITSLAGVLQNCRMLAVKQNQTMSTHFSPTATGVVAYVKLASSTATYTTGDSQVELEAPVMQTATTTGTNAPTPLDSTTLGFTPQTGDPSFNSTGLPCSYASLICATNYGFIYYFHDLRPGNKVGWAALSISPAGRLSKWYWNGSSWTS